VGVDKEKYKGRWGEIQGPTSGNIRANEGNIGADEENMGADEGEHALVEKEGFYD
jgi:hypothetical protein